MAVDLPRPAVTCGSTQWIGCDIAPHCEAGRLGLSHQPLCNINIAAGQQSSCCRTVCERSCATVHDCRCLIDEETAARIAREIERGDTSNPHLAEERGQEVDDSGVGAQQQSATLGSCCPRHSAAVSAVAEQGSKCRGSLNA